MANTGRTQQRSGRSGLCNVSVSLQDRAIATIPVNTRSLPVFVTPIRSATTKGNNMPKVKIIEKVLLKAVTKVGKSSSKMFTLRNVRDGLVSCNDVKSTIKSQLQNDIIAEDFDVGFISNGNVIIFRSKSDLVEFWSDVRAQKKVYLWCDGLKESSCSVVSRRRSTPDVDDANDRPAPKKRKNVQEDREEQVQDTIDELKKKHGSAYTPMQIRIWSEMIVGGIHASLNESPTSSMFVKAGKGCGSAKKKNENNSPMAEALTQAAVAISSALSPRSNLSINQTNGTSPGKLIESRSKCYKQLHDLSNLKAAGILSDMEYSDEKEAVLVVLKRLKAV